jgi:hypothetical protein
MAFEVEARTKTCTKAPVTTDPREALIPLGIVIVGQPNGMWRHGSNTIQLLLEVLRMGYVPE